MGNPQRAFDLITERDVNITMQRMVEVEVANDARKVLQDRIFKQGVEMLGGKDATPPFIFLHNSEWNTGICGISCSEMVEQFGVPAMMFGTYDGKIRGSGRSIPGINIKAVLDGCGDGVFEKYGGHEMACGATIKGGMFGEAKKRFGESLAKLCNGVEVSHSRTYDMDLPINLVVKELGDVLMDIFYPYCQYSNPEPIFKLKDVTVTSSWRDEFKSFVYLSLKVEKDGTKISIPISAFLKEGVDDDVLAIKEGDLIDVYFSFPQEKWFNDDYGNREYRLELVDVVRC
jgi:single-stranded-DNA-specific exonuclease